jgi:hypothetical protein
MYKVKDNVFWETDSCIERRNAVPLSDSSGGSPSGHRQISKSHSRLPHWALR